MISWKSSTLVCAAAGAPLNSAPLPEEVQSLPTSGQDFNNSWSLSLAAAAALLALLMFAASARVNHKASAQKK